MLQVVDADCFTHLFWPILGYLSNFTEYLVACDGTCSPYEWLRQCILSRLMSSLKEIHRSWITGYYITELFSQFANVILSIPAGPLRHSSWISSYMQSCCGRLHRDGEVLIQRAAGGWRIGVVKRFLVSPAVAPWDKVVCLWGVSISRQLPSLTCICACPWHYHQQICTGSPEVRLKYCWGFWGTLENV